MELEPQGDVDIIGGTLSPEAGSSRRKMRQEFAAGIIQALTIALVIATITTVVKLDKHVCVMDEQYRANNEALQSLIGAVQTNVGETRSNTERIVAIESKFVPVEQMTDVWQEFANIKNDVIKNSLTINPNIQNSLNEISRRLDSMEQAIKSQK